MKTKHIDYIRFSSILIIITCIGEFASMFILGSFYPGYSQLKDTMSALGATASPVSFIMSTWWIIMGIFFVNFGVSFNKAFSENRNYVKMAAWVLILYGFGEGFGSGAFKADHLEHGIATSLIIHDTLGGIGVFAILSLPLIMLKIVPKSENPGFHKISKVLFISGILMVSLFLFRYSHNKDNFFLIYKGIWQRLFMLNTYIYITLVAGLILKKTKRIKNQNAELGHQ